jgi:hypothetical protein
LKFVVVLGTVVLDMFAYCAAVAALRSAARFLDVEVDSPPLFLSPPLTPWLGGGAFGAVRGGAKIGP